MVRLRLIRYLSCSLFCLHSFFGFCQNISFQLPDALSVCQSDEFQILITNTTGEGLENVRLTVELPCNLEYVASSIQGGLAVSNININRPEFILPAIGDGTSHTVRMRIFAPCSSVNCIDNGDLFNNVITLSSNQGDINLMTQDYIVESALPLITKVDKTLIRGIQGQTVVRKVHIQNTRPGTLDSLFFTDDFGEGLTISSNLGQIQSSVPGVFRVLLTANDFNKFGDGDNFFEFNETIVLEETIFIDACGFDRSAVRSSLDVDWGCQGINCQNPFEAKTALIDLDFKVNEGPVLEFEACVNHPPCLCTDEPQSQSIKITNTDEVHSASSIVILLNTLQFRGSGFPEQQLVLKGLGTDLLLTPEYNPDLDRPCMNISGDHYAEMTVEIPHIPAGATVELFWDVQYCNMEDCYNEVYQFEYEYYYIKDCTIPSDAYYFERLIASADIEYILEGDLTAASSFEYLDERLIEVNLQSPLFESNSGTLDVTITVPCYLETLENDWNFNGVLPRNIQVEGDSVETLVTLSYDLPLPFDAGTIPLPVRFLCNDACNFELCKDTYITSCPGICDSDAFLFAVDVLAQLNLDQCSDSCPIQTCPFQIYFYDCDLPFCDIFIPGYLDSEFKVYRFNTGLPDNDNDHFPDAGGTLNEDLIRRDRVITGDTLRMEITGEIVIDIPGESFTKGLIDIGVKMLRSFGVDVNFQLVEYSKLLDSQTGLISISENLVIKDASSGNEFVCTEVPLIFDPGAGERTFDIDLEVLRDEGCGIPLDYRYEHGDSIILTLDYFVNYNFQSLLLNFGQFDVEFLNINTMYDGELGGRDDLYPCGCPTEIIEFANYKTAVTNSGSTIDFCFGNSIGSNFKTLKYGTFTDYFPYEYKPPVRLQHMLMPEIEGLELTDIQLVNFVTNGVNRDVFLNDPDSHIAIQIDSIIADTVPFALAEDVTGYYALDLTKDLDVTWDENVEMRITFNCKNQECQFGGSQDYLGTQLLEFAPGIEKTNFERNLPHEVALLGKQSRLSADINLCDVTSFSDTLQWEIDLTAFMFNNELLSDYIQNIWFYPVSSSGQLSEYILADRLTGKEFESTNGIFQLDSLANKDTLQLSLMALSSSCDREEVVFHFGWDCMPYVDTLVQACYATSRTCFGEAPAGLIDAFAIQNNLTAPLCDTFSFVTFTIFNAGLGPMTELESLIDLPEGLSYIEGSAQVEYPTGSGNLFSLDDPEVLGNNRLLWKGDKFENVLSASSLSGVNSFPENQIDIRFKVKSDCDFTSGARIILYTKGENICGGNSNKVAKLSPPLLIEGVTKPYEAILSAESIDSGVCQDTISITFNFSTNDFIGDNDRLQLDIPEPLVFVANSCFGDLVDCQPQGAGSQISFLLPEGRDSIHFGFRLAGALASGCDTLLMPLLSISEVSALCVEDSSICDVKVATGEFLIEVPVSKPVYDVYDAELFYDVQTSTVNSLNVYLKNISQIDSQNVTVGLYLDNNGNEAVDIIDSLLGHFSYDQLLLPGEVYIIGIDSLDLEPRDLCRLMIAIEEDQNCVCRPDLLTIPARELFVGGYQLCSGDTLTIGVEEDVSATYSWLTSPGLDCENCAFSAFTATNTDEDIQTVVLNLVESFDDGCEIQYQFDIEVLPQPGILNTDKEICRGDGFTLIATEGDVYQWDGPGVINPSSRIQILTGTESGTYYLTITDLSGCTAVDSVKISVRDNPAVNAGEDIAACYGQDVILNAADFGDTLSYLWTPGNPWIDEPQSLNPTVLVSQSQDYVLEVSDGRCNSLDTVSVSYYDGLEIPFPSIDTFCLGDEVMISLPDGFSYSWNPSYADMCQNVECSEVIFLAEEDISFQVVAQDMDMCLDTGIVVVHTIDSSDAVIEPERICLGDSVMIFGNIVTDTGLYCDTTFTSEGCLDIRCIDLLHWPQPAVQISASATTVEPPATVQLSANNGFIAYEWTTIGTLSCNNCVDPELTVSENDTITLIVTDANGCQATDTLLIETRETCENLEVLIPNAFTANSNNKNDIFRVANDLPREAQVQIEIYDRWGELLFEGFGNDGWDGTYRDEEVPEGVYLYIIRIDCGDGDTKLYKGDVTLIR